MPALANWRIEPLVPTCPEPDGIKVKSCDTMRMLIKIINYDEDDNDDADDDASASNGVDDAEWC
eukprot:1342322-Amphidinium_carterae.1